MMRWAFATDMARAFGSRGFLAAAAGILLTAALGVWRSALDALTDQTTQAPGFAMEMIGQALDSKYLLLAAPILAALPFTAAFVEDVQTRYIRNVLPRTGRSAYLASRVLTTGLSGGGVLVLGAAGVVGVFFLLFWPFEGRTDPLLEAETAAMMMQQTRAVTERMLLLFLSGFFWASTGSLFACVTMNPHMGLCAPFIFFYVLVICHERYFPDLYIIDPRQWLYPDTLWEAGTGGAALLVTELCVVISFLLAIVMEKRIRSV